MIREIAALVMCSFILFYLYSNEEFGKASYDILLKISASLKDSSAISDAPYHKLIYHGNYLNDFTSTSDLILMVPLITWSFDVSPVP